MIVHFFGGSSRASAALLLCNSTNHYMGVFGCFNVIALFLFLCIPLHFGEEILKSPSYTAFVKKNLEGVNERIH